MTRIALRIATLAVALGLGLGWAAPAPSRADDQPKDEALDRILEKIDVAPPDDARADNPKKDETPAPKAPKSDDARPAEPRKPDAAAKPSGDVSTKDEAIDSLLEKLGEAEEKPAAPGKPAPKPSGDAKEDEPPQPGEAPKPDQPAPDALKGRDRATDEHLEELIGRRHRKPQDDRDAGALSQSIKQMREVEKRLAQPDTGEETRKKQQEIVKELDRVLEQCRVIRVKGGKPDKSGEKPKPGEKQPGSSSNGTGTNPGEGQKGNTQPKPPKNDKNPRHDKDPWGHLGPEEQAEKDNSFAERPLPGKESLVDRYYLSISKKTLAPPEK